MLHCFTHDPPLGNTSPLSGRKFWSLLSSPPAPPVPMTINLVLILVQNGPQIVSILLLCTLAPYIIKENYTKHDYTMQDYTKQYYTKENYTKQDYTMEDYTKQDHTKLITPSRVTPYRTTPSRTTPSRPTPSSRRPSRITPNDLLFRG